MTELDSLNAQITLNGLNIGDTDVKDKWKKPPQ